MITIAALSVALNEKWDGNVEPLYCFSSRDIKDVVPSNKRVSIAVNHLAVHVVVRLTSGVDYRGVLSCLDGYMNIALEQTEEHVGGKVINRYGDAFIRGNNVLYISAAEAI